MNPWPSHTFRALGGSHGIPPEVVENALDQAHRVQQAAGLPAILTLRHLARQTEVSYTQLRQIVERSFLRPYRIFPIRKRAGGRRLICVPHPSLLRTQKWLTQYVLSPIPVHPCSFAYAPGSSTVDCARLHCRCRWLIKVDVRHFFESISERQVYYAFRSVGYQPLIAFELARICTRVYPLNFTRYSSFRWQSRRENREHTIQSYASWCVGHLPQGAPTSPMLSNLVMLPFDRRVQDIASGYELVYTRYADDLIFSSSSPEFSRVTAAQLIRCVFQEMATIGLHPHTTKTVVAPPGARKVVLGLLVDTDSPRLLRTFRSKLQQHIYCLKKNGPAIHAARRGFKSLFSMLQHIRGLLNYATQVDPDFARPLWSIFHSIDGV